VWTCNVRGKQRQNVSSTNFEHCDKMIVIEIACKFDRELFQCHRVANKMQIQGGQGGNSDVMTWRLLSVKTCVTSSHRCRCSYCDW